MINDPIINEVHQARHQILKEAKSSNLDFGEYLLQLQKKFKGKLVSRKPHLLKKKSA